MRIAVTGLILCLMLAGCVSEGEENVDEAADQESPTEQQNATAPPVEVEEPNEPCASSLRVEDESGDVANGPEGEWPRGNPDSMDLLSVSMIRELDGLAFVVELASDPREDSDAIYYFWVKMEADFETTHGNPPTWTIQRSSTYDSISSMYYEERSEYSLAWNGSTFRFVVPWEDFEAEYGEAWPIAIGNPRASSQGPYTGIESNVDWAYGNAIRWQDSTPTTSEFVPLPEC